MFSVGRVCMKIAGRDAGLKCVVVDIIDAHTVLIDGETRRRKCNMRHLEPLEQVIKLKKGASHNDVAAEFMKLGIELRETKQKQAAPRPMHAKKEKMKLTEEDLAKVSGKKIESTETEEKPATTAEKNEAAKDEIAEEKPKKMVVKKEAKKKDATPKTEKKPALKEKKKNEEK